MFDPELTAAPKWRPARLALVGERMRAGWDLFAALRSVVGASLALTTKLRCAPGLVCAWRISGYVPDHRLLSIAAALNIPPYLLPTKDQHRLEAAAMALRSGASLLDALVPNRACGALGTRCGVVPAAAWTWAHQGGVPPYRRATVAHVLGVPVECVPISRGRGMPGWQRPPETGQRVRAARLRHDAERRAACAPLG
jgi:hypothetical protein